MSVKTLTDGTQIADFQFDFALSAKAMDDVVVTNDDGSLYIEGYASDFDVDRQDEAFEPGAFERGLQKYLTTNPILLYHHKSDVALGQVEEARIDAKGMYIKARVDEPEPGTLIADYYRKIKKGTLRAFSVGGKFMRRMTDEGPRIFDVDLGEISVTPYPVNPRTLFAVAGKAYEGTETTENEVDMESIDAMVGQLDRVLSRLEGKASSHPDGYHVAALLAHVQAIHTLSEDTHQNAQNQDVKDAAKSLASSAKRHSTKLYEIAAKVGPLPHHHGPVL